MQIKRAAGGYYHGTYGGPIPLTLLRESPGCNTCKACVYDSGMRYRYCFFTGEILPVFDKLIGAYCPIKWEEEDGCEF